MRESDRSQRLGRREFITRSGAAGMALVVGAPATILAQHDERQKPNIIFLFADDMRWDAMGCMGNRVIRTPNLDRLANDGVLFENAFVTTSICAPNRACVLAGQHQRTTGIRDFAKPFTAEALDQTYPVLLRRAGYRTGFMGKWGVGASGLKALELPASRFDYWRGFVGQGQFFHEVDGKRLHLTTDVVPRQTREFLDGCSAEQPFCLSISFKAPHGPWSDFDPKLSDLYTGGDRPPLSPTFTKKAFDTLPEFLRTSLNGLSGPATDERWGLLRNPEKVTELAAQYYRLITGIDIAVSKIVAELRSRNLDRNTVIILTSDNGHFLCEQGLVGKWLMYEPSIRVPLLVYDPRLPAKLRGRRRREMALTIDMAPTMLAIGGVTIPKAMQGRDLGPLIRGERVEWRKEWFYEHTFTLAPPRTIAKTQGVRTERWKYVRYLGTNPNYEQLFDLKNDPDELANMAEDREHQAVLERLRARLEWYRKALPDNAPEPQEYGHFRDVYLSSERGDAPHDLGTPGSLGQTFLAEGHKIHSLRFRTPTWGKSPAPCGLIAELLVNGPQGRLLATRNVARQSIHNNGSVHVMLEQAVEIGQPIYLRIRPDTKVPTRTIGVWGYDEILYLDGTGHSGDRPQTFGLELSIRYEDPEGFTPPRRNWEPPPKSTFRVQQGQALSRGSRPSIEGKSVAVSATIHPKSPNGVIVAQGGHANGYALYLTDGRLAMATRHSGQMSRVIAQSPLPKGWVQVRGRLGRNGALTLEVAGEQVATGRAPGPIPRTPGDPLEAGADRQTAVGEYAPPNTFIGRIRDAIVKLE
ncbi:MAG: sulfatase-like hydrolase/transferase [Lentisphaerae bacterium]|jgi:arylsulfatase A-like enzyme|nr:sulfatase-like hydrolase/transferase [Lentisphaerota bacterium]MBT4815457.1 sulfatase-like hydrolase/transferase [Lentisphaerota bacterium]MBT5605630.1 sulfatase-like hydrolase/transferase [Lentisphaerota bacterium]MBT7061384.1 sulfatase-like hydrolase/transferase [Lentisphaerota bacterium]MBT7842686.1 sulfatase-like hydrolase/transferase [Lentisphaerota bacterium]